MNIHGLTVCVNYADMFERSIGRWAGALTSLCVVTSSADVTTQRLVRRFEGAGVTLHVTDVFYANGAAFNKGAAMQEAIDAGKMPWSDWWLFFDADIIPPAGWQSQLELAQPRPGMLYGAPRFEEGTNAKIGDREWPGYFQLFSTADPAVKKRPLLETDWSHAGNYDSKFQDRWGHGASSQRKVRLQLHLVHQGDIGNWHGRGPDAKENMAAMYRDRRAHGGSYEHERIDR